MQLWECFFFLGDLDEIWFWQILRGFQSAWKTIVRLFRWPLAKPEESRPHDPGDKLIWLSRVLWGPTTNLMMKAMDGVRRFFDFHDSFFDLSTQRGAGVLLFTVLSDNRWGQGVFWEDVCMNESIWPSNYQHWRGSRVEKSRMSMWRVVLKKIIEHQWRNLDTVWTVWVHGSPQKNLRLVH